MLVFTCLYLIASAFNIVPTGGSSGDHLPHGPSTRAAAIDEFAALRIPYSSLGATDAGSRSSLRKLDGVLGQRIQLSDATAHQKPPPGYSLNDLQSHGTTTMAFVHRDAVIVCVDSKASIGSYVGSRTVKKVFPVADSIVATMAGGAADCAHFIRRTSRVLKIYQYELDMPKSTRIFAHLLAKNLKEYQGAGSSDMSECIHCSYIHWG